jgi:hypothetical protein
MNADAPSLHIELPSPRANAFLSSQSVGYMLNDDVNDFSPVP